MEVRGGVRANTHCNKNLVGCGERVASATNTRHFATYYSTDQVKS
jgi:hypothetical protein